jgi:cation diffusion facilitator CzcD-associated flavoprotein CzcO
MLQSIQSNKAAAVLDLIIIGAGIGGVIALYYARRAGLCARVLERQGVVGGLWAQLPAWQDIQCGRSDWTLGDLPIAGEDQASIRDNIESWVHRFGLADFIEFNSEVTQAIRESDLWLIETPRGTYRAKHVVAATGAHNRPLIPDAVRDSVELRELHSSALREPERLLGQDVLVVGGGASAYDLLELCFEHRARRIIWVYRQTRWMVPTRKPKSSGGPRELALPQMQGATVEQLSSALHADMLARYQKHGLEDILPSEAFDLRRHQLIPGRRRMIENYGAIERHRGEIAAIAGRQVTLSTGQSFEVDDVLWGTGYEMDLGFFANPTLSRIRRLDELAAQCGCGIRAIQEPGLYFMAAGLDSTSTAPWVYCLMARTIMSHIAGTAVLELEPLAGKVNHFHYAAFLAERDPKSFPKGRWESHYLNLAATPASQALPIPD